MSAMLRRGAALVLAGATLCAWPAHARPERPAMRFASPGKIVGAEVAFQQLAQRKGQWAAFRATAASDAVMFVPQPVVARDWLKKQPEPATTLTWQPHQVWLSCDGSLAVSYGAWQRTDGQQGYFTTVWQRQKDGDYKWVMDQGDTLTAPMAAPEMIGSSVGYCAPGAHRTPRKTAAAPAPSFPAGTQGGWSDDRTLRWSVAVAANCARTVQVSLQRDAGKPMDTVLEKQVAAAAAAACPVSGPPA